MKTLIFAVSLATATLISSTVIAAVSQEQADQLRTSLTPFGAEKAGNKTGEIPPWTGGMKYEPKYAHASSVPVPYGDEKPILKIDESNVDQYAGRLAPSLIALVKNFKGFYLNIYPTHRDGVAPRAVYDAIYQNALHATLVNHFPVNAVGGTPFPIPDNGEQVAWNINWIWEGVSKIEGNSNYIVPYGRSPILSSRLVATHRYDGFIPGQSYDQWNGYIFKSDISYIAPPARAGEQLIAWEDGDAKASRLIWQYLVGQHRLRKAPNIAYDGAFPDCAGFAGTDELEVWGGHTDRYSMKLLGKREMYVPYDDNGYTTLNHTAVLGPHYLNPDTLRFELHRVWVVDMTLAPGARHIIPHRTVYVDEDTWTALLGDEYNAQGQLWRANLGLTYANPGVPTIFAQASWIMDLHGGGYCAENFNFIPEGDIGRHLITLLPESAFEPDTIAANASR